MNFSRQRTNWRLEWPRRLIAAALLVSLCASFVPLPLASDSPSTEKDRSAPFPCQDRPCGCRSAQQCWKQCCCFTNEQKLAWAARHNVAAPAYVLARCATEKKTTGKKATSACGLCATAPSSCCAGSSQPACGRSAEESSEQPAPQTGKYVIGIFQQQCQGAGPFWNALPWTIFPASPKVSGPVRLEIRLPFFVSDLPADVCFAPPVPPPRAA